MFWAEKKCFWAEKKGTCELKRKKKEEGAELLQKEALNFSKRGG